MYETVQNCKHCGANLTLDDMRQTNCPYCHTVYPHHSQAAQHSQVVGQVMNQMMAQQASIQNQWRGAYGVPPLTPGPPPVQPGQPYDPNAHIQASMQHAQQVSRNINIIVLVAVLGAFLMVAVGAVVIFLLAG